MAEEKVKSAVAAPEAKTAKGEAPKDAKAAAPVVAVGAGKAASRKRVRKTVSLAHAHVTATYNNTIISIAEPNGNVLAWASAGACGFKGTRKSTPYAATVTAEKVVERVVPYGVQKLKVFVKGVGTGREQAIRGLHAAGLEIEGIFD
ncbi:30S ribosomal protein S11, partial [Candidatus Peregrinibacteria bacterium]|nr:30S ribosomal protein S11 [Candidatus Peregrinibacteria bacterium]